jgi:hypothetical protein
VIDHIGRARNDQPFEPNELDRFCNLDFVQLHLNINAVQLTGLATRTVGRALSAANSAYCCC